MKQSVYLDNAATTMIDSRVAKVMDPYFASRFGNPSSIHSLGLEAKQAVDDSRSSIARFFRVKPENIIFTSGATESNNLAILGAVGKMEENGLKKDKIEIISTQIEHPSVLEPIKSLRKLGVKASLVKPGKNGVIKPSSVKRAITSRTRLISIMYANNEIGSIQPVREIGSHINKINKIRRNKIIFHSDIVQAINYLNCVPDYLGVDLMSASSHKIYGPKGVGLLYCRDGGLLRPLAFGGGQERGLRSGTLNVPLIIGFSQALLLVEKEKRFRVAKIKKIRNLMYQKIRQQLKDAIFNSSRKEGLISIINLSIPGVEGESLLTLLDLKNISLSTGSACSSNTLEGSHVLAAIGVDPSIIHSSIRISLSKYNTVKQARLFVNELKRAVYKLRRISSAYRPKTD